MDGVIFFGQSGPYAPVALRALRKLAATFPIRLVVEGFKRGSPGQFPREFVGNPTVRLPQTENLQQVATAAGLAVLQTDDVNSRATIERVQSFGSPMGICVGFDRLFTRDLLNCFSWGILNAHPSFLPTLRGPSPIYWALRQGQSRVGVSIHQMDKREDHGLIYAQQWVGLRPMATAEEIFSDAAEVAAQLLVEVYGQWQRDELHGVPQSDAQATRAPRPVMQDSLVDPAEWRAQALANFVEGTQFFRSPWMRLSDRSFILKHVLQVDLGLRLPGQDIQLGNTLAVQCQDGVVHFEIQ